LLLRWLFGLVVGLAVLISSYVAVERWLGLGPYGSHIIGFVVAKNVVTYQGRGSRVEYLVHLRTKPGRIETVAVPEGIYRQIQPGWRLERKTSAITATSPDATHAILTATQY
jgi:hypothetical protein